MTYYFDFSCWEVKAENEAEARKRVFRMLKEGKIPDIREIEENEDGEGDNIEYVTKESIEC